MKKSTLTTIILLVFAASSALAGGHPEKWYQEKWCNKVNGKMEVSLPDDSRCDCVTSKNAVEFDFAKKWSEAIGQSLNYSMQTGKRAGIVLIVEKPDDRRFWIRLNSIIMQFNLPIDTWIMTLEDGER